MTQAGELPVALITGASSGIGLSLSRQLCASGYRVAMLATAGEELQRVARDVGAGRSVMALTCDVRQASDVRGAVQQVEEAWGPVELAIANAGVARATWATALDLEAAQLMMDTNYRGLLNLYAAVIPSMLELRRGCFVGVASLAGLRCLPGGAAYSASKAAIQAFLDTVRPELAPRGVRVVTVNPWFVRTPRNDDAVRRPLMVEPEWAARAILVGIERGRRRIEFPRLAALGMRSLRLLPDAWFDWWVGRRYRNGGTR